MVRSLPEKTFEHWASMYVAHRFAQGSLWWPTRGEDVRVEDLGTVPGKAMLLEFKVPEQQPNGGHVITVDVPQLHRYLARRTPVYYAFPEPPWTGTLSTSAWLWPERRADLAYRRTRHRWFGEWTRVCSAADLCRCLNPSRAAKTAVIPQPFPGGTLWADFWRSYKACGSPVIPSLFIVPDAGFAAGEPTQATRRTELRRQLGVLRRSFREQSRETRESSREALRDSVRYMYAPLEGAVGDDLYGLVTPEELNTDLAAAFARNPDEREAGHDLAICAIPFDALDVD